MLPLPIHYAEVEEVFSRTIGHTLPSLALTAAIDGEGVSTLAYALARRSAAAGLRTLLVDFNLRNPSIGPRLGCPSTAWTPEDESSNAAIIPLSRTGLSILPAPHSVTSSWGFRDAGILRGCFARWHEQFDRIVADTSPLSARNQDNVPPETVAAVCEGSILTVLTGRTTESDIVEASDRLAGAGARLVGVVLNDRFAPTLADELCRETRRMQRWLPGLMETVRRRLRTSMLLNQAL
jgi:protein-tyrosine kinase